MPPRSYVASSRRPLSAIFLGSLPPKDPKEANIPALPEPPESPGAAAPPSGLPSPPATNSTGSGSTGDNNSANSGSIRQRPVLYSTSSTSTMPTETHDKYTTMSKTSRPNSDDEDDENDYAAEEDTTARLDHRIGAKSPSENIAALQRVKSLAQRNRMALDKLSSRLNTPSPTHTSRSPHAPRSSTSTSSSRLSSHSHSHSVPQVQHSDTLSGSETERESLRAPTPSRSDSNSYRSSSPERSTTPPSAPDFHLQRRLTSAPTSPAKVMRQASPGPSRTPRKRVSIASAISVQSVETGRYSRNDHDVTEAALAAVASSRRSPTGNKRPRQPLPREFRDSVRERRSLDGRGLTELTTPHRTTFRDDGYDDDPPRTAMHTAVNSTSSIQYSPRGARSTQFSTVRDLTRRHQTRWLSDDISGNGPDSGRKQSQRGGSAESALNGGGVTGRLAGESLRAAGIGTRGSVRQASMGEDVFGGRRDFNASTRGHSSLNSGRAGECGDGETQRRSTLDDGSRASGPTGVLHGAPVPRPHLHSDPTRASATSVLERDTRGFSSRPATSMADFLHSENDSRNGSNSIRSRRTAYDLSDRPDSRHSPSMRAVSLAQTPSDPRAGTPRHCASLTPGGNGPLINLDSPQNAEHTRLMLESLSMFKAQLSRLPNLSQTVRDVSDHSSAIIRSSERLNKILRAATTNAVQQQIAIEVDDGYYDPDGPNDPAHIWRDVGSDFREGLRESDDVVRSLTGFILGVGKLLKEVAGAPDSAHLRSVSLDDEVNVNRRPPSDGGKRSQDGRRSVESRLSWEPLTSVGGGEVSRRLTSRSELSLGRPPSSRDGDSTGEQVRSISRNGLNPPPTSRRLFAPREHREQQMTSDVSPVYNTSNVLDLSLDHEPSPTPASRYPLADRTRPPLYSTPPPLPSLPSESLLQRSKTTLEKGSRRNLSLASINIARTPNTPFALSTPNPTTAITTHTASASAEVSTFRLERSDSRDSAVTFSRPSGASVSTLQRQQTRDEERRRVGTATEEDPSGLNQIRPLLSGSETERDTRRRTIGVRAARMSLEAAVVQPEASGSKSQPKTITFPSQKRERRRTVTEIFG